MSVLRQIKNTLSNISNPAAWLIEAVNGGKASSGVRINAYTALTISTVWQAVRVISGDVGQMPLNRYQKDDEDGRKRLPDPLIETKPGPVLSPLKLKETLQAHALVYGNGYAHISRTSKRTPTELSIIAPSSVEVVFDDNNNLRYKVTVQRNGETKTQIHKPRDILHIRGLGFDGLKGYSVVSLAADSFGLAKAAENHGGSYFRNNATPSGLLSIPGGRPKQEVVEQSKRDWETLQSGDNESSIALMYGGMEFKPLSFTNLESQFLESREFSRTDIASWFNIPPHKVGDLARATFSNIEEQNRDYLTTSLMYWLVNWQQECNEKLLTDQQRADGIYYEFNTASLLKGDTGSRFEAYASGINNGWMSRNEARKLENLNPVEGLDEYLVPLNMSAVGELPEEDSATSTEEDEENQVRAAIIGIVRMEGNRICKTSETAKNFNDSVSKFYGQFGDKLWEVIEPLGATTDTLEAYLERSESIWHDLSETCTQDELSEAVSQVNDDWNKRADQLTKLILEDKKQ